MGAQMRYFNGCGKNGTGAGTFGEAEKAASGEYVLKCRYKTEGKGSVGGAGETISGVWFGSIGFCGKG